MYKAQKHTKYIHTVHAGATLSLAATDVMATVVEGNNSNTVKEICLRLDNIMGGLQRGISILATAISTTTGVSV